MTVCFVNWVFAIKIVKIVYKTVNRSERCFVVDVDVNTNEMWPRLFDAIKRDFQPMKLGAEQQQQLISLGRPASMSRLHTLQPATDWTTSVNVTTSPACASLRKLAGQTACFENIDSPSFFFLLEFDIANKCCSSVPCTKRNSRHEWKRGRGGA